MRMHVGAIALLLPLACQSLALADTVQATTFLGNLLPSNEVPPTTANGSAVAIMTVYSVRDNTGAITSGSFEFRVLYKFAGAATITGLHIHSGPVGVSGPIVIPTDISSSSPVMVDASGKGTIVQQVQFGTGTNVAVSVINDLLSNPQNYYVNLHTTDYPGGAIRSQLFAAQGELLMGILSPANETPPVSGSSASGVAAISVLRSLDSSGNLLVANVNFNLNYTGFAAGTVFTGFHIHQGPPGVSGPIVINTGISSSNSVMADASGAGNLNYDVPITPTDATFTTEANAVSGLFSNPTGFYTNLHTTVNPNGEIRAQLRTTDRMVFQLVLNPANEVPPVSGSTANAPTALAVNTLRNSDGSVAAGFVNFDVNYRGFPAGTVFTGLHIHSGGSTVSGPIVINTGLSSTNTVMTNTGNGNITRGVIVSDSTGLDALNGLVQNPANFYVNIHTTVNSAGAARAQLAAAPGMPVIGGVAAASSTVLSTAPGGILSIYGTNLAFYTSDLSGFDQLASLPTMLNGVTVTIGGVKAPFYFVSPAQLNVQVPFEVPTGITQLIVNNAGGGAALFMVNVSAAAPSIFIVNAANNIPAVLKNSDFSLVTPQNPAKVGDAILIYLTGLGQTSPTLQTGSLQTPSSGTFDNTVPVSVSIGGKSASVIYSIAAPGFAGLYQTAVTVPSGVSGSVPLVVSVSSTVSNTVNLAVQ